MQAVCVYAVTLFPHDQELTSLDLWSAKFYPYTKPGVDPIFAVVGGKHVSHPVIMCLVTYAHVLSDPHMQSARKQSNS